jgi:hypothetical protein
MNQLQFMVLAEFDTEAPFVGVASLRACHVPKALFGARPDVNSRECQRIHRAGLSWQ